MAGIRDDQVAKPMPLTAKTATTAHTAWRTRSGDRVVVVM